MGHCWPTCEIYQRINTMRHDTFIASNEKASKIHHPRKCGSLLRSIASDGPKGFYQESYQSVLHSGCLLPAGVVVRASRATTEIMEPVRFRFCSIFIPSPDVPCNKRTLLINWLQQFFKVKVRTAYSEPNTRSTQSTALKQRFCYACILLIR